MRSVTGFWRVNGGATAVEFSIAAIPLLLMMFGTFEFGRLLWTREALQETAAAGARCMGMSASSCQASGVYNASDTQTYIEGVAATWGVTLTSANLSLNNSTTCAGVSAPKSFSTVTISYTFDSAVPSLVTALAGGEALSTTACFPNN